VSAVTVCTRCGEAVIATTDRDGKAFLLQAERAFGGQYDLDQRDGTVFRVSERYRGLRLYRAHVCSRPAPRARETAG
jgi:hypothetical protein